MTSEPAASHPAGTRTPEQTRTLTIASLATFLVLLTFVTPLATQARTAAALDAGAATQPWLLSAISVGLAVALLPAGAAADDLGRRRVFVLGLVVLAAGALICVLAPHPLVFIAGRLVQGLGGGAVLACALGLIGHAFPPGPGRTHATGMWGASVGSGIALGGVLPVAVDLGQAWRPSYAVTAVAAALLAVLAQRRLAESRAEHPRPPDLLGAGLLGAGLAGVCAAMVQARAGVVRADVLVLLGVGAVLLVVFVRVEARSRYPMLDLALFRRPQFVGATVAALTNGAGGIALASLLPTLVQQGLGESLLTATLLTLMFAGLSVVTALNVKRLTMTPRTMMVLALTGIALGQLGQVGLTADSGVLRLVPGLAVVGAFFGVLNASLGRESVASVPPERTSMGSGANNTARYVGSAVGVSIGAVLLTRGLAEDGAAGLVDGWNTAALLAASTSLVGALVVLAARPRTPSLRR